MKRLLMLFLMVFVLPSCQEADYTPIKYSSSNHVYTLDLVLDVEEDTLEVKGEVSYLNEIENLDELYLHLYPNAVNPTDEEYNVSLDYLRINNETTEYTIEGVDNTLLHMTFDEAFPVDERISIEFDYTLHYWDVDRLSVINDNYYMTMFFYPFVPVYDEDGWNNEPYSFRGESYFNTVGDYYVTLRVPEDYQVAASGKVVDASNTTLGTTIEYEILNARDFSFSASNQYYVYSFDVEDRTYDIYSMERLFQSEQELYLSYVTTAFDVFEEDIGPYDYDHFTLELGYIYGMESTGVIYCSSDVSEGTVVHEVIHQWFYSMIGNDQSDEPFLDEALVTYLTSLYFLEIHGEEGYNGYLDYRSSLKPEAQSYFDTYQGQSGIQHLSEYGDGYAYLVYYHGPTIYRYYVEYFLDGDIDRFTDALSVYYDQYKHDYANIDEFFTLLEDTLEEPGTVDWLYEQATDLQDLEQEQPN